MLFHNGVHETIALLMAITGVYGRQWPNSEHDQLVFINNPVEAQMPGHWMPLSILKHILQKLTLAPRTRMPRSTKISETTTRNSFFTLPSSTLSTTKSSTIHPFTRPPKKLTTVPPTQVPRQQPTSPSTQPTTEPPTKPTTKTSTEPTTKPTTQPPTQSPTQPQTKPTTEPTTNPKSHSPTQPPTQPTTKPTTQPPTEPPTEIMPRIITREDDMEYEGIALKHRKKKTNNQLDMS